MAAVRTGPKDATSNLSEWIVWMGLTPPRWLNAPVADSWGKRIAVAFIILSAITFTAFVYGYANNKPENGLLSVGTVSGGTINVYKAPVTQIIRERKSAPAVAQNLPNIYAPGSIIAPQGGHNEITNNIGPQPRNLDSPLLRPLKEQILHELPKDKEITVMATLGDGETIRLANQIQEFLQSSGFKLKEKGISQGVFSKPINGLVVQPQDGGLLFIVGPNLPN